MEPCSQVMRESKVTQKLVLPGCLSQRRLCKKQHGHLLSPILEVGDGAAAGLVPPEASLPGKRTPPPLRVPTRSSCMCVLIASLRTPVVLDWGPPW